MLCRDLCLHRVAFVVVVVVVAAVVVVVFVLLGGLFDRFFVCMTVNVLLFVCSSVCLCVSLLECLIACLLVCLCFSVCVCGLCGLVWLDLVWLGSLVDWFGLFDSLFLFVCLCVCFCVCACRFVHVFVGWPVCLSFVCLIVRLFVCLCVCLCVFVNSFGCVLLGVLASLALWWCPWLGLCVLCLWLV